MEDVVRVLETAAAFVPDASGSVPNTTNGAATNLMDAAAEPLARFPGFEDPFASNPFASSTSESSELHTPLSTGMPGVLQRSNCTHVLALMRDLCGPSIVRTLSIICIDLDLQLAWYAHQDHVSTDGHSCLSALM